MTHILTKKFFLEMLYSKTLKKGNHTKSYKILLEKRKKERDKRKKRVRVMSAC